MEVKPKKKLSRKTKKLLVAILVAVGSFIAGNVSEHNKPLGEFIRSITTVVGGSIVQNTDTVNYEIQ